MTYASVCHSFDGFLQFPSIFPQRPLLHLLTGKGVDLVSAEDVNLTVQDELGSLWRVGDEVLNAGCNVIRRGERTFICVDEFVLLVLRFHLEIVLRIGIQTGDRISEAFLLRERSARSHAAEMDSYELSILVERKSTERNRT